MSSTIFAVYWKCLCYLELKVPEVKILYKLTNILRTELGTEGYRSLVPETFTTVMHLLISRELLCSKLFFSLEWNGGTWSKHSEGEIQALLKSMGILPLIKRARISHIIWIQMPGRRWEADINWATTLRLDTMISIMSPSRKMLTTSETLMKNVFQKVLSAKFFLY